MVCSTMQYATCKDVEEGEQYIRRKVAWRDTVVIGGGDDSVVEGTVDRR